MQDLNNKLMTLIISFCLTNKDNHFSTHLFSNIYICRIKLNIYNEQNIYSWVVDSNFILNPNFFLMKKITCVMTDNIMSDSHLGENIN